MLGGIEHACLSKIVFKKPFSPDVMAEELCKVLFCGMLNQAGIPPGTMVST
jgi:hypothetical protein